MFKGFDENPPAMFPVYPSHGLFFFFIVFILGKSSIPNPRDPHPPFSFLVSPFRSGYRRKNHGSVRETFWQNNSRHRVLSKNPHWGHRGHNRRGIQSAAASQSSSSLLGSGGGLPLTEYNDHPLSPHHSRKSKRYTQNLHAWALPPGFGIRVSRPSHTQMAQRGTGHVWILWVASFPGLYDGPMGSFGNAHPLGSDDKGIWRKSIQGTTGLLSEL